MRGGDFWLQPLAATRREHRRITREGGSRVIVTGRLRQRSFETKDGERRTVVEVEVDEVGPSLRYATAKVAKTPRTRSATEAPGDPGAAGSTRSEELPF